VTPRRWHWQLASDGLVTQLRGQDRRILQLAVPAFFTAGCRAAVPGGRFGDHLGTNELTALGIASSILLTMVGLFVFLA
jgi:Na+-driven multidrug efflux pump